MEIISESNLPSVMNARMEEEKSFMECPTKKARPRIWWPMRPSAKLHSFYSEGAPGFWMVNYLPLLLFSSHPFPFNGFSHWSGFNNTVTAGSDVTSLCPGNQEWEGLSNIQLGTFFTPSSIQKDDWATSPQIQFQFDREICQENFLVWNEGEECGVYKRRWRQLPPIFF